MIGKYYKLIKKISILLMGIFLYLISPLVRVKKGRWIFGASNGYDFKEGSKYMMMYLAENTSLDIAWITFTKIVKKEVEDRGLKCLLNRNIKGLLYTLTAEVVFTSTSFGSDVNYCFPKKNRIFVYLYHGMPIKKAINDQPQRQMPKGNLTDRLYRKFVAGFKVSDINYLTSTSDFYTPFLKSAFKTDKVYIVGMPRNDALFKPELLDKLNFFEKIKDKFTITYMPTHRDYGNGELPPFLFKDNNIVNNYFQDNNIILLIKNHPNMINKVVEIENRSNIIEITKYRFDAQSVIYYTDLLITDFSSVWIDYLLLRRPIIFYLYDNYEIDDNETYFDIRKSGVGPICENEHDLFNLITEIFNNYKKYIPSDDIIKIHHKYMDGNSCERLYNLINHDLY